MAGFDGVVIGGGHNGLTLAAYLTRAGMRIAVLERNSRIGGGSSTEERILPGFKLNLHANFYMGIGLCPLLHHRHGLFTRLHLLHLSLHVDNMSGSLLHFPRIALLSQCGHCEY